MSEKNNSSNKHSRASVLIAPLDWGIGHATRCIPIINELLRQHFEVIIAASGAPLKLLKKEFSFLEFLSIENYNIHYSSTKFGFSWKIISQLPGIWSTIRKEKRWLSQILGSRKIDFVVSDNRPGLHHPRAFCIYITHQINVKTGYSFLDFLARKIHGHFIRQFDVCWIPDISVNGLAGELCHPIANRLNAKYIHPLSRFEPGDSTVQRYDIAVLLSGPEPQRSILEHKILSQLTDTKKKVILIRGLPDAPNPENHIENPTVINHLPAYALNEILCNTPLIVSRSGYTSIMDYVKLQKKAILIPTPGQTEQEYLGKYLAEKKYFLVKNQYDFDLEAACIEAQNFDYRYPVIDYTYFKNVIKELTTKNT